jgi:hypothetical protein
MNITQEPKLSLRLGLLPPKYNLFLWISLDLPVLKPMLLAVLLVSTLVFGKGSLREEKMLLVVA